MVPTIPNPARLSGRVSIPRRRASYCCLDSTRIVTRKLRVSRQGNHDLFTIDLHNPVRILLFRLTSPYFVLVVETVALLPLPQPQISFETLREHVLVCKKQMR